MTKRLKLISQENYNKYSITIFFTRQGHSEKNVVPRWNLASRRKILKKFRQYFKLRKMVTFTQVYWGIWRDIVKRLAHQPSFYLTYCAVF